jgi:hypothetical protein
MSVRFLALTYLAVIVGPTMPADLARRKSLRPITCVRISRAGILPLDELTYSSLTWNTYLFCDQFAAVLPLLAVMSHPGLLLCERSI